MKNEADVKKEIVAYLKSVGAWYDNPVRNGYGRRGVPDIVVCYRGRFLAIEAKRPPGEGKRGPLKRPEADPWQQREMAAVIEAGGRAIVAWSVDHVHEEIQNIDRELSL